MEPRRTLLLGTAALVATAGVVTPLAASAKPKATTATEVSFAQPVIVDNNDAHSVGEPSIRVSADGAIYITGPAGLGGARVPGQTPLDPVESGGDLLWRSTDGGKTWTYLQSYDGSIGGGDSDITSDPSGNLYASGLTLACVTTAASSDQGETWVDNPDGCTQVAGLDDRQWNDVDGSDSVVTVFGSLSGFNFLRSVVKDPTVVNGPAMTITGADDYQWPGVVDVDQRTGTSYVVWNTTGSPNDCDDASSGCAPQAADGTDDIKVSIIPRGASTTTAPVVVAGHRNDTFDSFVDVDTGRDGTVYVVWTERHPEVQQTWTMLASSHDGGATWSAPVHVDQAPNTTTFPWVSAGDGGRVAVSYYGTSAGGNSPETANGDWYVYSSMSTDGGQTFTEHQLTPSYIHQGPVCTSGTGCASGTRDLLDFFETDYDATGCLVVAYTDNSRDTVNPDGSRKTDAATWPAFVRQQSGPGLLSSTDCGGGTSSGTGGGGGGSTHGHGPKSRG